LWGTPLRLQGCAPQYRTRQSPRPVQGSRRKPTTEGRVCGGKKERQGSETKFSAAAGNGAVRTLPRRGRAAVICTETAVTKVAAVFCGGTPLRLQGCAPQYRTRQSPRPVQGSRRKPTTEGRVCGGKKERQGSETERYGLCLDAAEQQSSVPKQPSRKWRLFFCGGDPAFPQVFRYTADRPCSAVPFHVND